MTVRTVGAAEEQAWNDAILSSPVEAPGMAFWTYRDPAVVLGPRHWRRGVERDADVAVVRRRSGGGAVLAGPWLLSCSVVLPRTPHLGVGAAFDLVAAAHITTLRRLGIEAVQARDACALPSAGAAAWACFGSVTPGEVVTPEGRKLVGLAQVRRATGTLVVAGLLLEPADWPLLCSVMGGTAADAAALRAGTAACGLTAAAVVPQLAVALALALSHGRKVRSS